MALTWAPGAPVQWLHGQPGSGLLSTLILPSKYDLSAKPTFVALGQKAVDDLFNHEPWNVSSDFMAVGLVFAFGGNPSIDPSKPAFANVYKKAKVPTKPTRIVWLEKGRSGGTETTFPYHAIVGAVAGPGNILAHELGHITAGLVDEDKPRRGTSWNVAQSPIGYDHWLDVGAYPPYVKIGASSCYRPEEVCHMLSKGGNKFRPWCKVCSARIPERVKALASEV